MGREQTCLFLGGQWIELLRAMEKDIVSAGGEPWIPVRLIEGSIILAVDEFLPDSIVVTPKVASLVGTTTVTLQRWLMRGQIAATGAAGKATPHPQPPREEPAVPPAQPAPESPDVSAAVPVEAVVEAAIEVDVGDDGVYAVIGNGADRPVF